MKKFSSVRIILLISNCNLFFYHNLITLENLYIFSSLYFPFFIHRLILLSIVIRLQNSKIYSLLLNLFFWWCWWQRRKKRSFDDKSTTLLLSTFVRIFINIFFPSEKETSDMIIIFILIQESSVNTYWAFSSISEFK